MREILFRGKIKPEYKKIKNHNYDWDGWIYGDLIHDCEICENCIGQLPVIPESVGQYTGVKDINGNMIFEGDILKNENSFLFSCVFTANSQFQLENIEYPRFYEDLSMQDVDTEEYVICGKAFDNPELLEVAE